MCIVIAYSWPHFHGLGFFFLKTTATTKPGHLLVCNHLKTWGVDSRRSSQSAIQTLLTFTVLDFLSVLFRPIWGGVMQISSHIIIVRKGEGESGLRCKRNPPDLCFSVVVGQPAPGEDEQPLFVVQGRRPLLLLRALDQRLLQYDLGTHPGPAHAVSPLVGFVRTWWQDRPDLLGERYRNKESLYVFIQGLSGLPCIR